MKKLLTLFGLLALPLLSLAETLDALTMLKRVEASYAAVKDYTCEITRRERFKDELKDEQKVLFKYKSPGRFYMKWPDDRIEAIYAEGKYENKMVIHGGLIFSFTSIAVDPKLALKYSRHTLLEADIGNILKIFETNVRMASNDPEAKIAHDGDEDVDGRPAWRFKAVFPPNKGYYGHIVKVHIDKGYVLPVRIEVHGWQNELQEMYQYSSLKFNVGLTDDDFDVKNSAYMFGLGKRASNEPR